MKALAAARSALLRSTDPPLDLLIFLEPSLANRRQNPGPRRGFAVQYLCFSVAEYVSFDLANRVMNVLAGIRYPNDATCPGRVSAGCR